MQNNQQDENNLLQQLIQNDNDIRDTNETQSSHVRSSYIRRLRALPIFDGDSHKTLRDFLDIAEALNDSWMNNAEKDELFETMNLQLRGEARNAVGNIFQINFDEIKQKLLKHFAYLSHKDIVTSKLENLHQRKSEGMSEYADRARKLLKEKK